MKSNQIVTIKDCVTEPYNFSYYECSDDSIQYSIRSFVYYMMSTSVKLSSAHIQRTRPLIKNIQKIKILSLKERQAFENVTMQYP